RARRCGGGGGGRVPRRVPARADHRELARRGRGAHRRGSGPGRGFPSCSMDGRPQHGRHRGGRGYGPRRHRCIQRHRYRPAAALQGVSLDLGRDRRRQHVVVSADLVDARYLPRVGRGHGHGATGDVRGPRGGGGAVRPAGPRHRCPSRGAGLRAPARSGGRLHRRPRAARPRPARPEGLARGARAGSRTSCPITWPHARRRSTASLPRLTKPWRLAPLLVLPVTLGAQVGGRGLELHLGRWYNGNRADVYEFRTTSPLGGTFTRGFGASVLVNDSLGRRRAFYGLGYEIQAGRGRTTLGPYALAGLALGLSTDAGTQDLAAQWSVGGGVEWRPLAWLAVGTEVRYRLEDRGPRGFWNPRNDARK